MTYSYVRQAWVEDQINQGIFGITLISRAAGIPEATGKTWLRQASHRLPAHKKMPREYERALGILLLEKYPDSVKQIALMFSTTPRMLEEWEIENRYHWEQSDLKRQTHYLREYLKPQIDEHFSVDDNGKIQLTKGRWPSSTDFEEKFFSMLDVVLYLLIEMESNFRASRVVGSWARFAQFMPPEEVMESEIHRLLWKQCAVHVPIYGPHKNRYLRYNNYPDYPYDRSEVLQYRPGRLRGVNVGGRYDPFTPLRKKIEEFKELYGESSYQEEVLPKVVDLQEFLEAREEKRQNKLKERLKAAG